LRFFAFSFGINGVKKKPRMVPLDIATLPGFTPYQFCHQPCNLRLETRHLLQQRKLNTLVATRELATGSLGDRRLVPTPRRRLTRKCRFRYIRVRRRVLRTSRDVVESRRETKLPIYLRCINLWFISVKGKVWLSKPGQSRSKNSEDLSTSARGNLHVL
jgi:hypothetical protein